jgi:transposase
MCWVERHRVGWQEATQTAAFLSRYPAVKKYIVRLMPEEQAQLFQMTRSGKAAARTLLHARILLKADSSPEAPAWSDEAVSEALEVHETTVARVRQRFVEEGLEAALRPKLSTRQYVRKLDGKAEAHLIALACGPAPEGRAQWTLRLLADQLVELQHVASVSHETVRQTLKKTNCSLT